MKEATVSGQIPPILWFLFWVGLSVGVLGFGFFMAIIIHRGHMKTLEILRLYAEKGIEPPPAVVEMLTRQAGDSDAARAGRLDDGREKPVLRTRGREPGLGRVFRQGHRRSRR